ncbi:hypothetical protein N0B51_07540 [Tsuneonella sp. YG55]|uniref:Uncharacterized protein n=1 Tax=Tsuneonella litorea TaxID=2976475 RepID=A0A9X2W116_9SPHN|nr:hypothetical protein [Tsuneonella litorea]MCT2558831.1 hypothetical protein [Tsuneonella litorea]
MNLLAILLATEAAAAAVPPPDEVMFEILVGLGPASGFRIDATERVELFDNDPHRGATAPEVSQAEAGTFAKAREQLARFRGLAGEPCVPGSTDVLSFRLSWREQGTIHSATFADSCKGIPVGLLDALRPIGQMIEGRTADSDEDVVELKLEQ